MIFKKIKQSWNNYLARLAKANKESFGDEPLDCCRVGREKKK